MNYNKFKIEFMSIKGAGFNEMLRRRRKAEKNDITPVLKSWEYDAQQDMMVRRIKGINRRVKIQMRLDLGILQMEQEGRPDGKRPHRKESLLGYFMDIVDELERKYGTAADFTLDKEDCYALQQEGVQYYYRYLCFFQLGDYKRAERDTARNLRLFDFVKKYALDKKYIEEFEQYRPYVMMMNTRAKVLSALKSKDTPRAMDEIRDGIDKIEDVYKEGDVVYSKQKTEVTFLKSWADEIIKSYTPSKKQRLAEELKVAVENEEYEKAAKIRDKLNKMRD